MGKGGSVIKVFWSIELSDLLQYWSRWSVDSKWLIKHWCYIHLQMILFNMSDNNLAFMKFCPLQMYFGPFLSAKVLLGFFFSHAPKKKGSPVPPCWPPTTSLAPFRKYVTSCCPFDMLVLERSRIIIKEMNWMAWITNVLVTPYQRCYLNPSPTFCPPTKSSNEIPFQKTKHYNPWKIVEKEYMCKSCGGVW